MVRATEIEAAGIGDQPGAREQSKQIAIALPGRRRFVQPHVAQIDVHKLTRDDFRLISYLKTFEPALYRRLRQQATGARAHGARRMSRRR
jgi:hypothetical protein